MDINKAKALPVIWVRNIDRLEELIDELDQSDIVAFDTEFIRRNTYYPILALMQINTGEHIYLLDVPQFDDLTVFWQSISELPLMIWHSCSEDLSIIYSVSDLPILNNVFDTQLAIAYLTGDLQVGYQRAVKNILDIDLDKAHSQSNWLARPLGQAQENYAVDDVRYLLLLYNRLAEQLNEKQLYQYALEETQILSNKVFQHHHIDDDKQYLSFVNSSHDGKQRYFLQQLLSWREALARATDQPRTFILRKQGIKDLLVSMPKTVKKLRYETSIHRSIINNYGQEIVELVKQAQTADKKDYPQAVSFDPVVRNKDFQKEVKKFIKAYAEKIQVPNNLIMKKHWQGRLVALVTNNYYKNKQLNDTQTDYKPLEFAKEDLPMGLQGWRYQWVVDEFVPFLLKTYNKITEKMRLNEIERDKEDKQ